VFRKHFAQEVYGELINARILKMIPRATDLQAFLDAELSTTTAGAKSELSETQARLKKGSRRSDQRQPDHVRGLTLLMQQIGGWGCIASDGWPRRWAGAHIFTGLRYGDADTAMVFGTRPAATSSGWLPIMGFFQLSVFAGYAIYFPELFPTYLRFRHFVLL
jgi:hypothetical protein